jgi:hypothetical protein
MANVGIATGDGLLVIDVDPRNGGDESWASLELEYGRLETFRVRTGSGGQHIYLVAATPVRSRNNWRPGVDLKGEGGYVVAPPSFHPCGEPYEVVQEGEVCEMPEWLVDSLGKEHDLAEATDPSPERLRHLAAPGGTPEERIRWTREAVAAIPHDHRFDDRNDWVGMAHAIRVSCGLNAEEEGFEIFDEFSERWEGPYDPAETRRVWETLPSPRSTGGYGKLLKLARSHGYEYPDDHPEHPQNEFEADDTLLLPAIVGSAPPYVPSPFKPLGDDWSWKDLLEAIPLAQALMRVIPPDDARVLEGLMLAKAVSVTRSWAAAQQLWRSFRRVDPRAVELIDGTTVIKAADPTDIDRKVNYLVDGIIPAAAVGELIAHYSTGKTWLLLDLALCVAFERPFFGRPTRGGPVIYLAYEGQYTLWKRVAGWLRAHDLLRKDFTLEELRDLLAARFIVAKIPPRFDQADIESLLRETISTYGARLVIIDTRGKSLGAELDENSADSANQVQGLLSAVAQETGASIIAAHHKPINGADRGRGSSAWTAGGDFAFTILGSREEFQDGKPVKLKAIKFRDDDAPRPVSFRLRSPIEMTVDGTAWSSAVIEYVKAAEAMPLSIRALVFLEISRGPGRGMDKIRKVVKGVGNPKIDEAIKDLLRMGAIEDRGDGRGHHYHPTPGWEVDGLGDVRHVGDEFEELPEPPEAQDSKVQEEAPAAV